MASNTLYCELIVNGLTEPTALQLDDEHRIIYALTNYKLTQIDLNKNEDNVKVVCQHNRKFEKMNTDEENDNDDDDDQYSQGESDDEEIPRVSDPYEDSEPSTDDDEETIENRRNWRREGWRFYQLDNPCSILFLQENNQLIVLNEGVITFLRIQLENQRPFVQGSSKNIFCYDFNVFNQDDQRKSIQPWSITTTSTVDFFIFSLLQGSQLYSLDMRNENPLIEKYVITSINDCPYLVFHSQSKQIFVYNPSQILSISLEDKSINKIDFSFIEEGKSISNITIDKTGHIYILSDSIIYKCILQSTQLHLIQCLGKINLSISYPQMIVSNQRNEIYISDMEAGSIYQLKKIDT